MRFIFLRRIWHKQLGRLLHRVPLCVILFAVISVTVFFALYTLLYDKRRPKSVAIAYRKPQTGPQEQSAVNIIRTWKATGKLITSRLHGQIGNMMFAYASVVGIGRNCGRTPVLPSNHFLRSMFHIKAAELPGQLHSAVTITELRAATYDVRMEWLPSSKQLMKLDGYFQSWKYFDEIKSEIRSEFTFQYNLASTAKKFLDQIISEHYGDKMDRTSVVVIGIHVRVGDMLSDTNIERGYTVASTEYLSTAMEYFRTRHATDNMLFVLATDDKLWCNEHFPYSAAGNIPVVHTIPGPDIQDMAILAACNHTVITVGSFGWWSAWLANGTTVYYRNFPRPNSSLSHEYSPTDYYPNSWIPL